MIKGVIYSSLTFLAFFTLLYTMDEPFMCKVPQENSGIIKKLKREQGIKKFADRWHWNVGIDQADRLVRLRERFGKQYQLSVLNPVIEEEVHKAFKACNITEPVIVLQDENSMGSACRPLVDELGNPVKSMAIGVCDNRGSAELPYIRYSIFHECGHIVVGDIDHNYHKKITYLGSALLGAGTCVGICTAKALKDSSVGVRAIGGIGAGFAGLLTLGRLYKTIDAYKTRKIERNADIFAAQKLISLHDCYPLMHCFLNFTYLRDEGKSNTHNEYWLFHDHPGYLERARIILDELRKVQVDLNNIPIDERLHPDKQDVQQKFTQQVKKYFPGYLLN